MNNTPERDTTRPLVFYTIITTIATGKRGLFAAGEFHELIQVAQTKSIEFVQTEHRILAIFGSKVVQKTYTSTISENNNKSRFLVAIRNYPQSP